MDIPQLPMQVASPLIKSASLTYPVDLTVQKLTFSRKLRRFASIPADVSDCRSDWPKYIFSIKFLMVTYIPAIAANFGPIRALPYGKYNDKRNIIPKNSEPQTKGVDHG